MSGRVDVKDIPAEVRKRLGLTTPRKRRGMTADAVRSHALRALSVLAELSKNDRARVLRHALKVNAV